MQKKDSSSCIAFYANADSSYRAHALKILANLSESHGPTVLNEADAVTTACHLITSQELSTPLSEAEERDCVTVICSLADDACNRAKIRQSGAFKRLLELAKNTTSDSLLSMVTSSIWATRANLKLNFIIFFCRYWVVCKISATTTWASICWFAWDWCICWSSAWNWTSRTCRSRTIRTRSKTITSSGCCEKMMTTLTTK